MVYMVIFICILIILVFAVVFQVVWIRMKLDQVETSYINRMSTKSTVSSGSRGYMGIYSVMIDTLQTLRMNDMNRLYYDDLRALITETESTFIIPSVCGSTVLQKPITITKYGFLLCKANAGSAALAADVKQHKTMYIVANGYMMLIGINDAVSSKVRETVAAETFVLYAIPLQTNNGADVCSTQFTPFLGSSALSDSYSVDNIDMNMVLGVAPGQKYLPLQLIAYNLYMA